MKKCTLLSVTQETQFKVTRTYFIIPAKEQNVFKKKHLVLVRLSLNCYSPFGS